MRLISVVMGEETSEKRSADTLAMLDYGFNMYNIEKVVDSNKSLGKVKVNMGDIEYVDIVSKKDITVLNNSQKEKKKITYEIETNNMVAPVKNGDKVGKISVYENGTFIYDVELTVNNNVDKANILKVFLRNLKDIMTFNI